MKTITEAQAEELIDYGFGIEDVFGIGVRISFPITLEISNNHYEMMWGKAEEILDCNMIDYEIDSGISEMGNEGWVQLYAELENFERVGILMECYA